VTGIAAISTADGIAKTFAVPPSVRQPASQTANKNRCLVTMETRSRDGNDDSFVIEEPFG
jgi:hypothetical protein